MAAGPVIARWLGIATAHSMGRVMNVLGTSIQRATLAAAVLCLSSCATTTTIEQSSALADAGIAYGVGAEEVILVTRDRYLDWQSDSMLASLEDGPLCTPAEIVGEQTSSAACKSHAEEFEETNAENEEWIQDLTLLSAHADSLGRYFQSLKAIASYESGAAVTTATEQLIDRINSISDKLEPSAKLSDQEKASWAKLAGLVADSAKAQYLKERLRKDAPAIGRAIDIQGAVLDSNAVLLSAMDSANRREQFLINVRTPYLTGGATKNPGAWRIARRSALVPSPEVTQITKLRSASIALKEVWSGILSDSNDAASARQVFDDVADALKALDDVRKARNKANAGNE